MLYLRRSLWFMTDPVTGWLFSSAVSEINVGGHAKGGEAGSDFIVRNVLRKGISLIDSYAFCRTIFQSGAGRDPAGILLNENYT